MMNALEAAFAAQRPPMRLTDVARLFGTYYNRVNRQIQGKIPITDREALFYAGLFGKRREELFERRPTQRHGLAWYPRPAEMEAAS